MCVPQLTFVIQLSSVFGEAFEPHPLAEQIQELLQRRTATFIVVHFLLRALARLTVKHPHLVLEAQLEGGDTQRRSLSITSCL